MNFSTFFLVLIVSFISASAQTPDMPINDNSFLIEEAYNQEKGVFQNILLMQIEKSEIADGVHYAFKGSFTQEWPLGGNKHQLSYSVPYWFNGPFEWLDNILINYRYQLEFKNLFFAPRISFQIPTAPGKENKFKGIQFFIPASFEADKLWTFHFNAGYATGKCISNVDYDKVSYNTCTTGGSIIYNLSNRFNLMFEALVTAEKTDRVYNSEYRLDSKTISSILNPGFRWAKNFKNDAQLDLGFSKPYSINDSDMKEEDDSQFGVLLYFSYEAFFQKH